MKVSITTTEGQFTATLKVPRALVLSAVITIAGFVAEAVRCESNIRELRAQLAHTHQQTTAGGSVRSGQ